MTGPIGLSPSLRHGPGALPGAAGARPQLESRIQALEAQQTPRDPAYVPPSLGQEQRDLMYSDNSITNAPAAVANVPGQNQRDLMYSDRYVNHAYSHRPTTAGTVAFWLFGVPLVLGVCALFIWLIWFKRWQPATA